MVGGGRIMLERGRETIVKKHCSGTTPTVPRMSERLSPPDLRRSGIRTSAFAGFFGRERETQASGPELVHPPALPPTLYVPLTSMYS